MRDYKINKLEGSALYKTLEKAVHLDEAGTLKDEMLAMASLFLEDLKTNLEKNPFELYETYLEDERAMLLTEESWLTFLDDKIVSKYISKFVAATAIPALLKQVKSGNITSQELKTLENLLASKNNANANIILMNCGDPHGRLPLSR